MGTRRGRTSAPAPAARALLAAALLALGALAAPGNYTDENKHGPCYRECVPGETMVCKFAFHEEIYNALNAACGRCADGVAADCFAEACVPVDGVERTVYTINRMLPGPAVHVCAGDTVVVDLHVRLPGHADTLHWHGLHQRDTPYMDGVSMVTQCPVHSGQIFRYQFVVDQPGTYFYHPHNGIHKVNGAVGVMVGRAPRGLDPHAGLYDADLPEHAVFLMDWMHVDAEFVFPGLHRPQGQTPVSVLINGQGNFQMDNGTWTRTPLAEFRVQRGLRYRFRVINSGGLSCPLALRVYGHKLTIIASDSRDVQPLEVDTLYTFSGERYDVVVSADQDGDAFWVHSYAANCAAPAEQVAVLRYEDAADDDALPADPRPSARPGLLQPEGVVMNSPACLAGGPDQRCATDLQSLDAPNDPLMLGTAEPEDRVVQEVLFHGYTNEELFQNERYLHFITFGRNIAGTIGNVSFMMPSTPLLTQPGQARTCAGCAPGEDFCICTHVLRVRLGARYEIVMVDATDVTGSVESMITHPMHLHGYSFSVLALGTLANITSGRARVRHVAEHAGALRARAHAAGNTRPVARDTIMLPHAGYAIVRIKADNPGVWFFHCHFQYHMASGMEAAFQVGEVENFVQAPPNFPKCGNYIPDSNPVYT